MNKPIEGADYFVYTVHFDSSIGGAVTPNDDGTYTVYINSNASPAKQAEAMAHELGHIFNGDFYNGKPIEEVEKI